MRLILGSEGGGGEGVREIRSVIKRRWEEREREIRHVWRKRTFPQRFLRRNMKENGEDVKCRGEYTKTWKGELMKIGGEKGKKKKWNGEEMRKPRGN